MYDDTEVIIETAYPVTITPPREAADGERFIFSNFDPALHVLNVDKVPGWMAAGDYIEYRRGRTVVVSIGQTEARWRVWLRRLNRLLKPSERKK